MSVDPIVDEVRRVRDELVKKHGGLDGWIDHLQTMDQSRVSKAAKRAAQMTSPPAGDRRQQKPRKPRGRVAVASRK